MNIAEIIAAYTKAADPRTISADATLGDDNIIQAILPILQSPDMQAALVQYVWGPYAQTIWGNEGRRIALGVRENEIVLGLSTRNPGFRTQTAIGAAVLWSLTFAAMRQKSGLKVPTNKKGQQLPYGTHNVVLPGAVWPVKGGRASELKALQSQCLSLLGVVPTTPKREAAMAFYKALEGLKTDMLGTDVSLHEARLDATAASSGFSKLQLQYAMAAIAMTSYSVDAQPITLAERPVVEYILANWYVDGHDVLASLSENVYLVDSWAMFSWWEHQAVPQELVLAFLLIGAALPAVNGKKPLTMEQFTSSDGKVVTRLNFEAHFWDVQSDGVYDDRRRRFNNSLVVNNRLQSNPSKEGMFLVNSFGTAMLALVNNAYILGLTGGKTVAKVGNYYKAMVCGETYPLDSEEESGGVANRGDRLHYSMGLAKEVQTSGMLPITWLAGVAYAQLKKDEFSEYRGSKASLDYGAFDLGLTRMHKGEMPFMPASMIAVQLKHFPVSEQDNVLKTIIHKIHPGLSVADGLRKSFPELKDWSDDAIVLHAKQQLCLGQSTYLAKLSKRVGVAYPKHAEPLLGEDRAFRRYGQTVGFAPGHTYNVAFCRRAIYTAGAVIQLVDYLKPVLNKHSYKQEFEFFDLGDVRIAAQEVNLDAGKCLLDFTSMSTKVDGVKAPGLYYPQGETIGVVPYCSKDGKVAINQFITMPEEGVLLKVVCDRNGFGALRVNLQYATIERVGKLRNNQKTLPCKSVTGKGCLYNPHNDTLNLPEGIELIVPGDADKSKDLMESLLDVAAQTAMQSVEGRAKVVALNAAIGISDDKGLVYSAAAAVLGLYDSFLKEFESDYGADIWLYHRDSENNIVKAIRELYLNKAKASVGGWRVVKPGESKLILEHGFEHALVLANGDPDVLTTDVLVFYADGSPEYPDVMYQRTYGFVGSAEKGHVRLNLKFELSSVAQAVSQSKLMASVIRAVATGLSGVPGDLEGAQALTKNCPKDMQTYIDFKSMYARRPFKGKGLGVRKGKVVVVNKRLPVVNCFTEEWRLTPEVTALLTSAELLTKSEEATLTLGDLAKAFGKVVFRLPFMSVGTPDLYLPAIARKDLKAGSTESLSGLILTLFRLLIVAAHTGGTIETAAMRSRVNRISGAFNKLMESEGFIKALTNGRMSAQCKLLGVFGVPVGEMWVLESANPGSFYQCLRKVFRSANQNWKLETGSKVGVARSPMPFFAGVKVVVVNGSDPRAQVLNDYQGAVSPLLSYINAGDHDGDDYVCCPANDIKIPVASYELVMRIIEDRIGRHPLGADVGVYIGDHFKIKPYVALSCWSESNLMLEVRTPDENMSESDALKVKRQGLKTMLWHAASMQQGAIGEGHEYAYTAECAVSIVAGIKEYLTQDESLLLSSWLKDSNMTLPLYELYENPLGGLSWATWDALKVILGIMKGTEGKEIDFVKLELDLDKAGMAKDRVNEFVLAANAVNAARNMAYPVADKSSIVDFVLLASEIMFLISKADFKPFSESTLAGEPEPNAHAAMASCYLAWQPARRKELTKHSILLQVVEYWLLTVGRAIDPNSVVNGRRLQRASKMGYAKTTLPGTNIVVLQKPTK